MAACIGGCKKKEEKKTIVDNTPESCNCMANILYQCGKESVHCQYLLSGTADYRTSYLDSTGIKYTAWSDTLTDVPYTIVKLNDSALQLEYFYGDDALVYDAIGSDSLVCHFTYDFVYGNKTVTLFKEHPDSIVLDISYSSYFKSYTYAYKGRKVQ
jgi:hypothetical protein